MKRTLLFLFCALMSTQMFSETLFGYLFPTLAYLERTSCHYMEGNEQNRTLNRLSFEDNMFEIDGNYYIEYNGFWLREDKKGRILVYSEPAKKDLVLYDFTLEVGDTLTTLNIDMVPMTEGDPILPGVKSVVVDYPIYINGELSCPIDTLIVTDMSMVMMRDSNEYKKWTFSNGMEYMEYIGNLGADFFPIIKNPWEELPACCIEERLVCASIYDRLIYQMDDAEMQRLNVECQCSSWASKWCDTWNVLEFNGMAFEQTAQTWQYKLAYDTIIDGKEYQAVTRHWTVDEEKTKEYVAAVRFEENSKAFIYYDNAEYLLYDFNFDLIEGDTLEVFAGINNYEHFNTYKCVIKSVEHTEGGITESTYSMDIIDPLTGKVFPSPMVWKEFVGSYNGILHGDLLVPGNSNYHLLCAYKNRSIVYSTEDKVFTDYGCEYNAVGQNPENLFPTLWGLQRTTFYHYTECSDSYSSLTASNEIVTINDKPYLRFGKMFLREENNQVLIYSAAYDKDLVLYDWNLEVGDSISLLAMDYGVYPEYAVSVVDYRVIVDIDENGDLITDTIPTDKVVVDKISTITLLDGKEYKTWHLATGWAGGITYVEGIGILSEGYGGGDYLGLIQIEELPTCYYGDLLVCVSKNNKLLYQMDPVKMDELGAECLCDYNRGPRKDNAKDGQIGGRPTPTQWNQLEVVLRQMDNNHTILQAETFSYTLEDISQQVNNKTYFQLARQSTKDTATTKSFVGALHFGKDEDNRVYFLRDGVEYVLYDFTAEIGDTVEIFAGINNYPQETTYTHVVVDKDTTEDGACRMFLEVVFPDETTTAENVEKVWLAGLGSVEGIVHNAAKRTSNAHAAPSRSARGSETESSVMLCAWREDSCLYTTDHPDYDTFGCVYNQDPTAVEDISTSQSSYQKLLRDGQLFIIHDGKTYNVLGVPVE